MSGPHVLIVGSAPVRGGEPHYLQLVNAAGLLVAADAGVELCLAAGRVPDVVVGDFDSVSPEALDRAGAAGSTIRQFPAEKDESDLDLSLAVAREFAPEALTITAAFSDRIDHTLAALGTLLRAADLHAVADEPSWRGYALSSSARAELVLAEPAGTVLSVLAPAPARVSIAGVAYPVEGVCFGALSSHGLSNVALAGQQSVVVHEGSVLVVVNCVRGR